MRSEKDVSMDDDAALAADLTGSGPLSKEGYRAALKQFDAAICEALAVGQAAAGRTTAEHLDYATRIYARICGHAVAFIRAAPKSRWTHSDSEFWDFTAVAGHARSIIEGQLLFRYTIKSPESSDEWSARLNVMHLNDCCRRIKVLDGVADPAEVSAFSTESENLRDRLRKNPWFSRLDQKLQKRLLSGDLLTITDRDDQIKALGWEKKYFDRIWVLLSQYTHVLTLSFYRMERNGRGTGIENDFDRSYIGMMLGTCAAALSDCVDLLVEAFPDTASARKGTDSKFAPGPARNRPRKHGGKGR